MTQILKMTSAALAFAILIVPTAAQASQPQVLLDIACELETASDALKGELKCHMRRVKGYGFMLGNNAQVRTRAAAIQRRFQRDPNYRGLDRDVAKIQKAASQLTDRLQAILSCPTTLARAEGDFRCVGVRVRQICSLAQSLAIAARPYCYVAHAPVAAVAPPAAIAPANHGRLRAARPTLFEHDFDGVVAPPQSDLARPTLTPSQPLAPTWTDSLSAPLNQEPRSAGQWQTTPRSTAPRRGTGPSESGMFSVLRPYNSESMGGQAAPQLQGPDPGRGN